MSYHRADEATPTSGAASMTVCTNHVALCHLVEDALPFSIAKALPNAELLVSQMVELQDDRVGLSAIDAGVLAQKRDQIGDPFSDHSLPATMG